MKDWRLNLVLYLFLLSGGVVILRLFYIQVFRSDHYSALADQQHWVYYDLPAHRGMIFSSDGYPLVANAPSYLLFAEPPQIADPPQTAAALAEFFFDPEDYDDAEVELKGLGNVKKEFIAELAGRLSLDLSWVALYHYIPPEKQEAIAQLELEGVGFEEEPIRAYPEGELAAHLLGFVGSDEGGQERGYYGVEGYYNGDLRGRPGKVLEERSAAGDPILVGGYQHISADDGANLVLTINRSLQYQIEQKLAEGVERYDARSGSVVLIEATTGAILALANYPTFDPADRVEGVSEDKDEGGDGEEVEVGGVEPSFAKASEGKIGEELYKNAAISKIYEPGSVMKAVTLAAGIDTRLIEPQTTFNDAGPIVVSTHTVDNWDGKHHGVQTMVQVLEKSNNIGAAWVGQKLGAVKLREYLTRFGIGSLTGVDLEGEDSGWMKPASEWWEIDVVTASFGQGVSITPLQLVSTFATLANQGRRMRPYVVARLQEVDREVVFQPTLIEEAVSPETAEVMVEMLTSAAEKGEAHFFLKSKYQVAGKTGTAQIPVEGKYDPYKTNTTFVGFLTNYPQYVLLVKLEEPTASMYASDTAVPLWVEMMEEIALFYGLPPDR